MKRTPILILLGLVAAACGDEQRTPSEPESAAFTPFSPPTATFYIGEEQYEYGCPTFPCPVLPVVKTEIDQGRWFWLPPGTFATPTIYLTILRTPVQLRKVPVEVIKPPILPPTPPTSPSLSGPSVVQGKPMGPIGQLTCGKFSLSQPVSGWNFATGQVVFEYIRWDSYSQQWVKTGHSSVVPFNATVWADLLAGRYTLWPPFPNTEYNAKFTVNLTQTKQGQVFNATVTHQFRCEFPAPPPPSLGGDGELISTWLGNNPPRQVCRDAQLVLTSPDSGPWSFVSGSVVLRTLSYNAQSNSWFENGQTITQALTQGAWAQLLAGTYMLDPGITTGPYFAYFTVTVGRDQHQHTLQHLMSCGSLEFYTELGGGLPGNGED